MNKTSLYPRYNKPNNQDSVFNGLKQCPKCHGTGKNTHMMMVPFQDKYPNDNNNKNPKKPFTCDNCNGTGKVPFIKPIICTK